MTTTSNSTMPTDISVSRGPSPKTIPRSDDVTTNAYQSALAPVWRNATTQAPDEDLAPAQSRNSVAHTRNHSTSSTTSQNQLPRKRHRTGSTEDEEPNTSNNSNQESEKSRANKRIAVESDGRINARPQTDAFVPLTPVAEVQPLDQEVSPPKGTARPNPRTTSTWVEPSPRRGPELTRKSSDVSEGSVSGNGEADGSAAPTEANQGYGYGGIAAAYSPDVVDKICLCQPEPKIPRPRNAFILYRQSHQAAILAQNPGLANPEISKVAGEWWRKENDSIKAYWKQLAEEEKARHQIQYPDYRFKPKTKRDRGSENGVSPTFGRCNRCGGKSINTPTPNSALPQTPFPGVRTTATGIEDVKRSHLATPQQKPSALNPSAGQASTPGMAMYADGAQSAGQRHFNGYQMSVASGTPYMKTPASAVLANPSGPATAGIPLTDRRGSVTGYTHYEHQNPRSPQSLHTSPMRVPHSAHLTVVTDHPQANVAAYSQRPTPIMGPPPPPRPRNSVHIHPGTPITARTPGLIPPNVQIAQLGHAYGHARNGSEVYRQLPMPSPSLTPGPVGTHMTHMRNGSMSVPAGVPMSARPQAHSIASVPSRHLEFIPKLKLLRRVAVPLSSESVQAIPSLPEPSIQRPRGAVVALEGDDWASIEAAKEGILDALNRLGDFDVHIWDGPRRPTDGASISDIHDVVKEWIAKRAEIESFVMDGKLQVAQSSTVASITRPSPELGSEQLDSRMAEVDARPYIGDSGSEEDDLPLRSHRRSSLTSAEQRRRSPIDATGLLKITAVSKPIYAQRNRPDTESGDQRGRSLSISHDRKSQTYLEVQSQKSSMSDRIRRLSASPSADRQTKRQKMSSSTTESNSQQLTTPHTTQSQQIISKLDIQSTSSSTSKTIITIQTTKIPILLIPHFILSACNAWAKAIPITDSYQSSDHWQWIATLWRGVIGADFTVYIQRSGETDAETAVEIKEDLGLIAVKPAEEGKVDEKAVRRVTFEIGEWVRGLGCGNGSGNVEREKRSG